MQVVDRCPRPLPMPHLAGACDFNSIDFSDHAVGRIGSSRKRVSPFKVLSQWRGHGASPVGLCDREHIRYPAMNASIRTLGGIVLCEFLAGAFYWVCPGSICVSCFPMLPAVGPSYARTWRGSSSPGHHAQKAHRRRAARRFPGRFHPQFAGQAPGW